MWKAYLALKTYHRRPSDDLDLNAPDDDIAAWCLDDAVLWFGLTVENLLSETREVGSGKNKRREPKYTLAQVLDPTFHPPNPRAQKQSGLGLLLALAGQQGSGVKLWTAKPN
jgi:hypothetical protein